jgi:hypothetical protein
VTLKTIEKLKPKTMNLKKKKKIAISNKLFILKITKG